MSVELPSAVDRSSMRLIQQGAEARLFSCLHNNRPCVAKERFEKAYRLKELDDRLRKRQLKAEVKALALCQQNGIPVPQVFDVQDSSCMVFLSALPGHTIRHFLEQQGDLTSTQQFSTLFIIALHVGTLLAKIHFSGLIHGDLTTSNMIIDPDIFNTFRVHIDSSDGSENSTPLLSIVENNQDVEQYRLNISQIPPAAFSSAIRRIDMASIDTITTTGCISFIDFGLSSFSENVEEKAVDLYVLERAVQSTHIGSEQFLEWALETYCFVSDLLSDRKFQQDEQQQQQETTAAIQPPDEEQTPPVDGSSGVTEQQDGSLTEEQTKRLARERSKQQRQARKEKARLAKRGYEQQGTAVLKRLEEVRARGRKKSMIG